MSTVTMGSKAAETMVGMGQIVAGEGPQQMKAIVGSCVALALYHARGKAGIMAHIVLPDSSGREAAPGKFADTAIPRMLELFRPSGVTAGALTAKLAGGANMFGTTGPLQIGDANIAAVTRVLRAAGVRILAQDVGGTRGRRVSFNCADGDMLIESAGQPSKTI